MALNLSFRGCPYILTFSPVPGARCLGGRGLPGVLRQTREHRQRQPRASTAITDGMRAAHRQASDQTPDRRFVNGALAGAVGAQACDTRARNP